MSRTIISLITAGAIIVIGGGAANAAPASNATASNQNTLATSSNGTKKVRRSLRPRCQRTYSKVCYPGVGCRQVATGQACRLN